MRQELNETLSAMICDVLDKRLDAESKLKEFVSAVWTIRTTLKKDICSYNLLHTLHFNYYTEDTAPILLKLTSESRDIGINVTDRIVTITNFGDEKQAVITLNEDEMSDELYNFIFRHQDDLPLDLSKLTEKYTINDIDCSGV